MFGYVQPDSPYLFKKDEVLYKALYCGICKSIGKGCGQLARTALTYDMAFISALVHNIRHEDVTIKKERCALHIIKRRAVAQTDDTAVLLGCINTVLAYYKLLDDKADGDGKGCLRHLYKKGLKNAVKKHPEAVKIIREQMQKQSELEKSGCAVIDMACEPTAEMMQRLSVYILGEYSTPHTERLFYCLGKWVYLADAVDDYEKDVKKGSYNVLYKAFGNNDREQAFCENREELNFVFDSLFADMRLNLSNIRFAFNHDLTDNVILRGIPVRTRRLIGCQNCKPQKKNKYRANSAYGE